MEQEQEDDQEHSNYQTAMFRALLARSQGAASVNEGWVPVAELHRLVSAKGNYPKATMQDIFAVAIQEISKGHHRYGDTVYKLYNMPWREHGDGMTYNITFIKLGSKRDNNLQGNWENYKKRPYPQSDGWQQ